MAQDHPSEPEIATFFIASIIVGQAGWLVGYNLGLKGTIADDHIFTALAVSLSALMASFIVGKDSNGDWLVGPKGTLLMIVPSLWYALEVFAYGIENGFLGWMRLFFTLFLFCVSIPYILYVILQAAVPNVAELKHRKLWAGLIAIGVTIGTLGFSFGYNNCSVVECYEGYEG